MKAETALFHPNILRIIFSNNLVQENLKTCKLAWLSPFVGLFRQTSIYVIFDMIWDKNCVEFLILARKVVC